MDLVNIVIPVYKSIPDKYELVSLMQSIKILSSYDFSIVCPKNLNTEYYENLFITNNINYSVQRFEDKYFKGLDGYNSLMLNIHFYERYKDYKYILIYQLDAYVFRDELEYWCSLGYDYIGAPWPENFPFLSGDNLMFFKVGNGGFSLRRTQAFIDRINYCFPLKSTKRIWREFNEFSAFQKIFRLPIIIAKILGYKNTMNYYIKHTPHFEDIFWCIFMEETKKPLKIPCVEIASKFSMEMGAKQLYQENNKLPFGCHAWLKWDFDFWKDFIKI